MTDWWKNLFFKKEKDQKLEQMRIFVIEVGRAHLACALVEQQICDLLRSFGYPNIDLPVWLTPGGHVQFSNSITALRKQFKLPKSFEAELHQFREERNTFTHNIWRDTEARIEIGEELDQLIKKVTKLYSKARALNNMFGRLKIIGHEIRYQTATELLERETRLFTERYSAQ